MREEFEKWVTAIEPSYADDNLKRKANGCYKVYNVAQWWYAWQAAYEAGRKHERELVEEAQ